MKKAFLLILLLLSASYGLCADDAQYYPVDDELRALAKEFKELESLLDPIVKAVSVDMLEDVLEKYQDNPKVQSFLDKFDGFEDAAAFSDEQEFQFRKKPKKFKRNVIVPGLKANCVTTDKLIIQSDSKCTKTTKSLSSLYTANPGWLLKVSKSSLLLDGTSLNYITNQNSDAKVAALVDSDANFNHFNDYRTSVYSLSSQTVSSATFPVIFDTVQYDPYDIYNSNTGEFQAKRPGWYHFCVQVNITAYTSANLHSLKIYKNGNPIRYIYSKRHSPNPTLILNVYIDCIKDDVIQIKYLGDSEDVINPDSTFCEVIFRSNLKK